MFWTIIQVVSFILFFILFFVAPLIHSMDSIFNPGDSNLYRIWYRYLRYYVMYYFGHYFSDSLVKSKLLAAPMITHPIFATPSQEDEWYVSLNKDFTGLTPITDLSYYKNLSEFFVYSPKSRDIRRVTVEFKVNGKIKNQRFFFFHTKEIKKRGYYDHSYINFKEGTIRLYNAKRDIVYDVPTIYCLGLMLYFKEESIIADYEAFEERKARSLFNERHRIRDAYHKNQIKKTLSRIDVPHNSKIGSIDMSHLKTDAFSDEFKDSCVKYNEAYDRLLKYDQLGEDILSILDSSVKQEKGSD